MRGPLHKSSRFVLVSPMNLDCMLGRDNMRLAAVWLASLPSCRQPLNSVLRATVKAGSVDFVVDVTPPPAAD